MGLYDGGKKHDKILEPWEKRLSNGHVYTDITKLPKTNRFNWAKDKMIDWVNSREDQIKNLAQLEYDNEIHPIDYIAKEVFNTDLKKESINDKANEIQESTNKRLKTLKYTDPSFIKDNSDVDPVYGQYAPSSHTVGFTIEPNKSTVYHETAHGAGLGSKKGTGLIINNVKNNSNTYKEWNKKNPNDLYFRSNEEINSRIYEIRINNNLKPNQKITPKDVNEMRKKGKNKLFEMFNDNDISILLNSLVLNSKKGLFNNKA